MCQYLPLYLTDAQTEAQGGYVTCQGHVASRGLEVLPSTSRAPTPKAHPEVHMHFVFQIHSPTEHLCIPTV